MSNYTLPPWIPEEVSEALRQASMNQWGGKVEVNYHEGHPMEISATRRLKIKRKGLASSVRCPECQRPGMESRDYGNLWVCVCGVKRTKAQLAQQGVAV